LKTLGFEDSLVVGNPPPKCLKHQKEAILRQNHLNNKSCNSKFAFNGYLSTHSSIRVHPFKSGNVYLARQLVWCQGPTELKHSQHSVF